MAPRYKGFGKAQVVELSSLTAAPKERKLSPAQIAFNERMEALKFYLNEASSLPASSVLTVPMAESEKAQNVRNAFKAIAKDEPRDLNVSISDTKRLIYIGKGRLPGRSFSMQGAGAGR